MRILKTAVLGGLALGAIVISVLLLMAVFAPKVSPDFEDRLASSDDGQARSLIEAETENLGVTALSVTIVDGDEPAQTMHFGRARQGAKTQAASLSKAVAAAVIMILAAEREVGLDDDIRAQITALDIASLSGGDRPVTLRQLLSHTTGSSQSGYPGYPRDYDIPTTAQVIADPPRMIEFPLEFDGKPGEFRYSGGGYSLAQLWVEDVTDEPFETVAAKNLLAPLGMENSTFTQPIEDAQEDLSDITGADAGFDPASGIFSSLDNSWHNYPEKAAAGLWTTSQDYARFVLALLDAAAGEENAIPQAIAAQMITPHAETGWGEGSNYGLGIMLKTNARGQVLDISHSGANAGYRAYFLARTASSSEARRVVVITANTGRSADLNSQIAKGLMRR